MANKDWNLINILVSSESLELFKTEECFEFPLDADIIKTLSNFKTQKIRQRDNDYEIYNFIPELKNVWIKLIEKAVKCLRYFDEREPFIKNKEKKPFAYGMEDLKEYFNKYIDFEDVLYGSNKYYRDHVVHVFRTWLLGTECLLKNGGTYINNIVIGDNFKINNWEKLSVWTIIALTHDLGYPLEKAQKIISRTQNMMSSFVSNPNISMDLSFSGVQNNMNDFVVRFLSSKMKERGKNELNKTIYVARLQPKYYFKFQKSLESSDHGIISTIIIYKLLTYFLESDYNINEDYTFGEEDGRQFYIRREILRAIASHTCRDIYHLYMGSFSFLLIIADDCQEWGRKCISELYVKSDKDYELQNINLSFVEGNKNICNVVEKFELTDDKKSVKTLLNRLKEQSITYIKIFRDGQDTINRDFTFIKTCEIECDCNPKIKIKVKFEIHNEKCPVFFVEVTYTGTVSTDNEYGESFFKNVFGNDVEINSDGLQKKIFVELDS